MAPFIRSQMKTACKDETCAGRIPQRIPDSEY